MMSPKDNDTRNDQINNKLNKHIKVSSSASPKKGATQKLSIGKSLKEKHIISLTQQKQQNAQTAMRFSNSNKLMVKPIINNSDSNTSIKASNKCNLIGKMINDVSKSTISGLGHSKQNDKTAAATTTETTATTTTAVAAADIIASKTTSGTKTLTKHSFSNNCSEGGTNTIADDDDENVVDDFHNNNDNLNNIDNERPHETNQQQQQQQQQPHIYTMTSLNEVNRESLSLVYEATIVDLISKQKQQQQQLQLQSQYNKLAREEFEAESSVTVKPPLLLQNFSKRMRHKNITNKPLDDSYQKTVDLDALNAREHNSQCELLEFTPINKNLTQKDYQLVKAEGEELNFKSLSERKALLKKEFFKDLNHSSDTNQQKQINTVKLKTNNLTLNKRILKKQHNLKLKIPRDCNKLLTEQPKATQVDSKQSLVALRKLDLQKKQQQQQHQPRNLKSFADNTILNRTQFPKVKELAKRFDYKSNMILPQTNSNKAMVERHSPLSDEGCNIGHSPYSSDDDNDSIRTTNTAIERVPANKHKDKVARSASSDSALGLEVDEPMDITEQQQAHQQKRRMTLTVTDLPLRPALLPLAEPTLLPDSPILDTPVPVAANVLQQNQIPTKVLLEERVVEIPDDPRSGFSSRRESSQSCFSDYPPGEMQGVRFVRTPSVVVSDYSDDITCGITLEEIEYFRAQRLRRRRSSLETSGTEKDALDNNSDISASSSCSNLYYCGSTISALDGAECLVNGVRQQLERKTSDCSTCSISGDEDINFCIPEQPEDCQDITDMLANQHLTSKRSKKIKNLRNTQVPFTQKENRKFVSHLAGNVKVKKKNFNKRWMNDFF